MFTNFSSPWLPLRDDEKQMFLRSGFTSITKGLIIPIASTIFCCICFVAVAVRPIIATTGKKMSEVKERQQRRKLRELKTAVEKSLWFA